MQQIRQRYENITLAVLAGGMGSRMGGAKAALQIGGENILSFLLRRLNWHGPKMLVTTPGRTAPPGADLFDCECVDAVAEQGPARGILTAIENTGHDVVFITVDMPGITVGMLDSLAEAAKARPNLLGLMFRRIVNGGENIEPFPCFLRAAARDVLQQQIDEQRRSVRGLLRDPGFAVIEAPTEWPASVWTNLNTPADLAAFEKALERDAKM